MPDEALIYRLLALEKRCDEQEEDMAALHKENADLRKVIAENEQKRIEAENKQLKAGFMALISALGAVLIFVFNNRGVLLK